MARIMINPACDDAQAALEEIALDVEAEGLDITLGVNDQNNIVATGSKSDLANLCCNQEFMDRFFTGQTKKWVKSHITY